MSGHRPLTKRKIESLLQAEGLRPSRRRGQCFLIDGNLSRIVADEPNLSGRDVVLEVGTGLGQLTGLLAERAGRVVTVEIDRGLVRILRRLFAETANVDLIEADVMASHGAINPLVLQAVDRARDATGADRWRVVANPPYGIAAPFILAALTGESGPLDLHLTLQVELAERLAGPPGTKAYGPAGVLVQAVARVDLLRPLPASCFWPRPAVDSVLVRMLPDPALAARIRDTEAFQGLVSGVFQTRRKTLQNGLARLFGPAEAVRLLDAAGIDPTLRPDALPVEGFIALANAMQAARS